MRRIVLTLLASTAVLPQIALAAETGATVQQAPAADEGSDSEIVVFGKGEARQTQEIKSEDIAILAPGTSPIRALEKLPSVNIQSADPFGAYEWSARVTIRGFSQNQLGFNLDGVPLGDMTYGNNNGLHISRAVSSDNIGRTVVSQGSGAINTQSTNNLGGTLEFFTIDPRDALGVDASASYGSSDTIRGFARIGVGSADGARAFASAQYYKTDKWKGEGEQHALHLNAKAAVPIGADALLEGYISYSDRAEQDYQDLSQDMIARLGYDWDNFGPSQYALAVLVADIGANRGDSGTTPLNPSAGTVYPSPVGTLDDAYYDASGLRRDTLGYVGFSTPIGSAVTLKLKTYYHHNEGQGTWGTPYVNSPSGVPMSIRTTEYEINRWGAFGNLAVDLGNNQLSLGLWYEDNDFDQARRFYEYTSRTDPGRDHLKFQRNPFFTQWQIAFNTKTFQYYVADQLTLDALKISFGWKGFQVDNKARAVVLGGRTVGDISTRDWFQPNIGLNYDFGGGLEAFAGFSSVTRAFASSVTTGPFSSTQAGFDAIKPLLKPETSDTYEAGLRYGSGPVRATLAGFYVDFKNRLLTIPTSVGIVGSANALQNVGSVRAAGIEATLDYKPAPDWTLFGSYSFNDNTYRDDVVINIDDVITIIPTKGKDVVDSPRHLFHGEVAYDNDTIFFRAAVNYMTKRYFTYTNDRWVDGRAIVDASAGYRFDIGARKPLEVQVNVTNLFDKKYVSTIGSNGFGNSGDNQTLLAGAPQQFFVTLKAGF